MSGMFGLRDSMIILCALRCGGSEPHCSCILVMMSGWLVAGQAVSCQVEASCLSAASC